MAYGDKYKYQIDSEICSLAAFKKNYGTLDVIIQERDYGGGITPIQASTIDNTITSWTTDGQNEFGLLKPSETVITYIDEDGIFDDVFTGQQDKDHWRLQIKDGSALLWQGYIEPSGGTQAEEYLKTGTLSAMDGLGFLEDEIYLESGVLPSGRVTVTQLLGELIGYIGDGDVEYTIACNWYQRLQGDDTTLVDDTLNPLDYVYVDKGIFREIVGLHDSNVDFGPFQFGGPPTNEEDKPIKVIEALNAVLAAFQLQVYFWNGRWHFTQPHLLHDTSHRRWMYTAAGAADTPSTEVYSVRNTITDELNERGPGTRSGMQGYSSVSAEHKHEQVSLLYNGTFEAVYNIVTQTYYAPYWTKTGSATDIGFQERSDGVERLLLPKLSNNAIHDVQFEGALPTWATFNATQWGQESDLVLPAQTEAGGTPENNKVLIQGSVYALRDGQEQANNAYRAMFAVIVHEVGGSGIKYLQTTYDEQSQIDTVAWSDTPQYVWYQFPETNKWNRISFLTADLPFDCTIEVKLGGLIDYGLIPNLGSSNFVAISIFWDNFFAEPVFGTTNIANPKSSTVTNYLDRDATFPLKLQDTAIGDGPTEAHRGHLSRDSAGTKLTSDWKEGAYTSTNPATDPDTNDGLLALKTRIALRAMRSFRETHSARYDLIQDLDKVIYRGGRSFGIQSCNINWQMGTTDGEFYHVREDAFTDDFDGFLAGGTGSLFSGGDANSFIFQMGRTSAFDAAGKALVFTNAVISSGSQTSISIPAIGESIFDANDLIALLSPTLELHTLRIGADQTKTDTSLTIEDPDTGSAYNFPNDVGYPAAIYKIEEEVMTSIRIGERGFAVTAAGGPDLIVNETIGTPTERTSLTILASPIELARGTRLSFRHQDGRSGSKVSVRNRLRRGDTTLDIETATLTVESQDWLNVVGGESQSDFLMTKNRITMSVEGEESTPVTIDDWIFSINQDYINATVSTVAIRYTNPKYSTLPIKLHRGTLLRLWGYDIVKDSGIRANVTFIAGGVDEGDKLQDSTLNWVTTAGFRPGMRIKISGSASNDGLYGRIGWITTTTSTNDTLVLDLERFATGKNRWTATGADTSVRVLAFYDEGKTTVHRLQRTYDEGTSPSTIQLGDPEGVNIEVGPRETTAQGFDFNNNDPSADTIDRNDGGSWITDGVVAGQAIQIRNSEGGVNDVTVTVASRTAGTITLSEVGALSATDVQDDNSAILTFHEKVTLNYIQEFCSFNLDSLPPQAAMTSLTIGLDGIVAQANVFKSKDWDGVVGADGSITTPGTRGWAITGVDGQAADADITGTLHAGGRTDDDAKSIVEIGSNGLDIYFKNISDQTGAIYEAVRWLDTSSNVYGQIKADWDGAYLYLEGGPGAGASTNKGRIELSASGIFGDVQSTGDVRLTGVIVETSDPPDNTNTARFHEGILWANINNDKVWALAHKAASSSIWTQIGSASSTALNDLTDVTITTPTTGDLLRYNGAAWVNYPDSNYAAASHTHVFADITDRATAATGITKVGTIDTGVWQGTVIDSDYLDTNVTLDNVAETISQTWTWDDGAGTDYVSINPAGIITVSDAAGVTTTINGGTISTGTNQDLTLAPNGTGDVLLSSCDLDANTNSLQNVGSLYLNSFTTNPEIRSDINGDLTLNATAANADINLNAGDQVIFAMGGGSGPDIQFSRVATNDIELKMYSVLGGSLFAIQAVDSDGDVQFSITGSGASKQFNFSNDVLPTTDSSYDLGSNTVRWANVYADTLYGDGTNLTLPSTLTYDDVAETINATWTWGPSSNAYTEISIGGVEVSDTAFAIIGIDGAKIYTGTNQDLLLSPNGTGNVLFGKDADFQQTYSVLDAKGIVISNASNHRQDDISKALVMPGANADFVIAVQDGAGRVNLYWNAEYRSTQHEYLVGTGSDGDCPMNFEMDSSNASRAFYFRTAPTGVADTTLTWETALTIDGAGHDFKIGDSGDATLWTLQFMYTGVTNAPTITHNSAGDLILRSHETDSQIEMQVGNPELVVFTFDDAQHVSTEPIQINDGVTNGYATLQQDGLIAVDTAFAETRYLGGGIYGSNGGLAASFTDIASANRNLTVTAGATSPDTNVKLGVTSGNLEVTDVLYSAIGGSNAITLNSVATGVFTTVGIQWKHTESADQYYYTFFTDKDATGSGFGNSRWHMRMVTPENYWTGLFQYSAANRHLDFFNAKHGSAPAWGNVRFLNGNVDVYNTFLVDTIDEHTTAAGVTIDGLLIKDGDLLPNFAQSIIWDNNTTGTTELRNQNDTGTVVIDLPASSGDIALTSQVRQTFGFSAAGAVCVNTGGGNSYLGNGTGNVKTTEAEAEWYIEQGGVIKNLRVYVSANDGTTGSAVVYIREDSINTTLSVTFGNGVTTWQSDTSNTPTVGAGSQLSIYVDNNMDGNITIETVTFELAVA